MADLFKEKWDAFCENLKEVGSIIESESSLSETDQAEGYRYLLRLMRLSLEMNMEHSNPTTPSFYNLSHETAKIGADNPDNIYLNANIDGNQIYEVYGNIGEADYLSFGLKENKYSKDGTMLSLGEIDMRDMVVDDSGEFVLYLGGESNSENFLPLSTNANMLIVRQTYKNRISQTHAKINIKTRSTNATPELLTSAKLETQLNQSLAFIRGTASTFLNWVHEFKDNHRNQLPLGDQAFFQAAGGDPKICYLHGYYEFDKDEFKEIELDKMTDDPLNFQDKKRYKDRLKEYRKKTERNDAFILGIGQINQTKAVYGFMNFNFMGGSMGRAVGQGIVSGAKKAIENNYPYIIFTSSGGARMQEGIISLMQMPRTVAAVELLNKNKIPYIVVLTEPTTGGVTASFAMLGDITIAEKGSTIGFAGKRVIQDTIREELPIDFQKAEYLLDHGMVDIVVHRKNLKKTLINILNHIS